MRRPLGRAPVPIRSRRACVCLGAVYVTDRCRVRRGGGRGRCAQIARGDFGARRWRSLGIPRTAARLPHAQNRGSVSLSLSKRKRRRRQNPCFWFASRTSARRRAFRTAMSQTGAHVGAPILKRALHVATLFSFLQITLQEEALCAVIAPSSLSLSRSLDDIRSGTRSSAARRPLITKKTRSLL